MTRHPPATRYRFDLSSYLSRARSRSHRRASRDREDMAGVAGGMLASAVLKVVFKQICAVIGGQITLQKDFTKDLQKMKMTLESVSAVLKDAERKSIENSSVQLWLKRLKNAMYDISDMLDELEADTQPTARQMSLKKGILQLASIGPKTKHANRMKKMREELKEITDQHVSFRLEVGPASNEQKFLETRETTVLINDEEVIVGRTEEKMKIMVSLSKSVNGKLAIFPIYGNGGIGKTTMAKTIFNNTMFNEYSRVWVYVSQMFDLKKIGNSIISQLSKTESQITEMQMIRTRLVELLADKNILIVLDDLWEDNDQFQLDELKKMLKVSEDSRIIVIITTRNESIANDLYTIQPYKLALLSDDSCWTIIKQHSGLDSRPDKKQLEQIGKDIARKCGGVALAAKVMGHMLRTFTSDEWESVRSSNIWNVSTSQETQLVLSSLRLTYNYMPSPLRLCFAYCAIFPKGQNMIKDDLIHQWISLGFIDTTHVLTTRQLGEKYITQLLGLSFLEHSAIGVHHKEVKYLTMHDLVHDLARLVLADELILGVRKLGNTDASRCRYALFDDCSKKLESYTDSPVKIRAMHFLDCGKIGLHGDAFSSAKYLRVLDLSECFIQELPDSVGQLKQLRYLNAPKIQHGMIPNCIAKLLKLFYLSFSGSAALLALPDSIGKMEGLVYLNLSGCSGLEKLPESFAKLKKLVHLDLSHCSNLTGVSESLQSLTNLEFLDISYCWNIRELPEHLGSLLKLKYLNMSGCDEIEDLPGSFGNLKNLVHLDLSHCCQIKVTPDVFGGLTKLHHLNLCHCGCIGGTKVAEAMSNLTEIRYLHLSGFMDTMCHDESAMSTSLEYISTLSNLEHLDLSCNIRLSHLPECITSLGKLHTLDLSDCSSLQSVPETIIQMHSLKVAYVKDCGLYSAWGDGFKVHADAIKGSNNLALLRAVKVTTLKVYRLEEVKSIEEMKSIKLVGEHGIDKLKFVWSSRYHERAVEDHKVLRGLEPASTVQSLDIESYNSILFPDWLMGIPAYNFPHLKSISLVDLGNCISLPPLGQLPNLEALVLRKMQSVGKIDEDFCGGAFVAFPRLESFTLDDMESLKVWNTTYSCGGYMFPSLSKLRINDCPKLRLEPCPPKADLWTIRRSDGVISSWEEGMSDTGASTSSSPPVTKLTIKGCKLPMHQWTLLHHLPALPMLCIEHEQRNEDSWSYLGGLVETSNMNTIKIERYNYKMDADLMGTPAYNFLDLVRISLEDLDNCISLPPLGQLPNLKSLYLRGMQSIEKIEEDFCGGAGAFPGLESFTLSDMPDLKVWNTTYSCSGYMFPGLCNLRIHDCPKLRLIPCPPKAEKWTIDKSDGVISMWGESTSDTGGSTSSSPPVTELTIQGCKLPMHQWRLLHHLPALPQLSIRDCSDLTSSPKINPALSSLKCLSVNGCNELAQLPEWLRHLTSLKKLDITGCKNIESLPESIQQLTKLEKLIISPSLWPWYETKENQMKLAHIKEKVYGYF